MIIAGNLRQDIQTCQGDIKQWQQPDSEDRKFTEQLSLND